MKGFQAWRKYMGTSTGWHRAAKINCLLLVTLSIVLTSVFISVAAKSGLATTQLFYQASCKNNDAATVDLVLHLLINIVSTLVISFQLASSNFFMQVLVAPFREELDAAHSKGACVEIGITSIRNVFKVSYFKRFCWLGLLITSLPIHLFFNSVVFSTEYSDSDYTLTIATEEFIRGGSYYLPGASLLTYDNGCPNDDYYNHSQEIYCEGDNLVEEIGHGELFQLTDYTTMGSEVTMNISAAAREGNSWDNLTFSQCQAEYSLYGASCSGLRFHSDLILIVEKPGGWVRNDMWHLLENQTHVWDPYVPPDAPNHLFYYTTCRMVPTYLGGCDDFCRYALGDPGDHYCYPSALQWPSGYPFFVESTLEFVNGSGTNSKSHLLSGLQPGSFNLSAQYCLARPLESICRVGMSPVLLFLVVLCVAIKTIIAILVTYFLGRRGQKSLVTLGDSIASFIEQPNYEISNYPVLTRRGSWGIFLAPKPQRWQVRHRRRIAGIPYAVWAVSYIPFIIAISICVFLLLITVLPDHGPGQTFHGTFLATDRNPVLVISINTFISYVLVANSPQIVLSLCYLTFNNLFTHFCVVAEWERFASNYLPLRVTDPKGEQESSYRLQLPYRYSLPLIALSAFLHWLLSNTLYIFVSEGGYFSDNTRYGNYDIGYPNLLNTGVFLSYSPISLFVFTIVASIAVIIPFIVGFKRLSSDVVLVGTDSRLILLACRVLPVSSLGSKRYVRTSSLAPENELMIYPTTIDNSERIEELDSLSESTAFNQHRGSGLTDGDAFEEREKIARSKIRWGVLPMPPEWYEQHDYQMLGFGVESDKVTSPVEGRWYK